LNINSKHNESTLSTILHHCSRPTTCAVILCHGYLASKDHGFIPQLAKRIVENCDVHVVRFDFTGCGSSSGDELWSFGGYISEATNLDDVIEYIKNKDDMNLKHVAILGHSRGADVVLLYPWVAARKEDKGSLNILSLIINIAGRYNLNSGIVERFGSSEIDRLLSDDTAHINVPCVYTSGFRRVTGAGIRDRFYAGDILKGPALEVIANKIQSTSELKLITIHCRDDDTVNFEEGMAIDNAIRKKTERPNQIAFKEYLEGGHRFSSNRELLIEDVIGFINEWCFTKMQ